MQRHDGIGKYGKLGMIGSLLWVGEEERERERGLAGE